VKNILLDQLSALRSLDFGTDRSQYTIAWSIHPVQTPLTYLRLTLDDVLALLNLMPTWPLCNTLHQLHVTIRDMFINHTLLFNLKRISFCMTHLHTFTFIKPFYQQFFDEWDFLEELTSSRVMPVLRRAKINVTISAADLYRFDQSPLFIDHRCVDVHFALALKNKDQMQHIDLDKRIPRGSRSHPRQIVSAAFKSISYLSESRLPVSSCLSLLFGKCHRRREESESTVLSFI
jgi:hypothetical protein